MGAERMLSEHLTANPSRIEAAGRELVRCIKAERCALLDQDRLYGDSLRTPPNVTQEQIEAVGKRLKACRLATIAAMAVLENEVDG